MNSNQILLIFCLASFYNLFRSFINNGGMNFPLLKILSELIMLLFFMILFIYKNDLFKIIRIDKFQKKIDDYYKKTNS